MVCKISRFYAELFSSSVCTLVSDFAQSAELPVAQLVANGTLLGVSHIAEIIYFFLGENARNQFGGHIVI